MRSRAATIGLSLTVAACALDWGMLDPRESAGSSTASSSAVASSGVTHTSSTTGGGASSSTSSSSAAGGGAGGAGGEAGGVTTPPLIDAGLVARYWLDEATAGQGPAALQDSAPSPVDLPVKYAPQMTWASGPQGRSLSWPASGLDGGAWTAVAGTKFASRIDGTTTATLEVVATVMQGHGSGSRLIHLGQSTSSLFSIEVHGSTQLVLDMVTDGSLETARWTLILDGSRRVYHLVFDSSEPDAPDRHRLYVDGVLLTPSVDEGVLPMQQVVLAPTSVFAIGNRDIGGRSIDGMVHYAAVYDQAFSLSQVLNNVDSLDASDDATR